MAYCIGMAGKNLAIGDREGEITCSFFKGERELALFPLSHLLTFSRGRPWDLCCPRVKDPEIVLDHGRLTIHIPGAFGEINAGLCFYFDAEKGLVMESEWVNTGPAVQDAMAGLCLPMPWSEGAKFTLPHCLYNDNPSADPERIIPKVGTVPGGGYIAEEHRLPIPALNIQWRAGDLFPHLNIFSEPSNVTGDFDSPWTLGLLKDKGGYTVTALSGGVMFNGEKDLIYIAKARHGNYPYNYNTLTAGAVWRKRFYLSWDDDKAWGMAFRCLVTEAWNIYRPKTEPAMSRERLTELKHNCLISRWFQEGEAAGYLTFGSANEFGNISGRPDYYLYGWTGECIKLAWCDIAWGFRKKDQRAIDRGTAAVDFFVRHSIQRGTKIPGGYYMVNEKRWGSGGYHAEPSAYSCRITGSSISDLLDVMELLKKEGRPVPRSWEEFVEKLCAFLTDPRCLNDAGIYPLMWDAEGKPQNQKITSAGIPNLIALVKAGAYFGGRSLIDYAAGIMERYYEITAKTMEYPFAYATMDARCEDKEAGMYFFIAAMELYKKTGEQRFIDWAGIAADWIMTFLYFWEAPLRPGSPCEKGGFRVSLWPGVSVQNHHLDVFFAPLELWEYGRIVEAPMYQDCARSVLEAWSHGVCEKPGDWGFTVPGEQAENYYQTNYSQSGDTPDRQKEWRGGASNWNPSWIIAEVLSACLRMPEC
ncbi:MAG: hypothetical protein LBT93_02165 [Treponema sp.]|nr:hypothetical protein [Treponema sp.]